MSKAFTKETDDDDNDSIPVMPAVASAGKNYITATGYQRMRAELLELLDTERPKVVETVHWAASNGDRSENGDYIYGKKRLREIDRRIRFLTQRLKIALVTDPSVHHGTDQVFFGATVGYLEETGQTQHVTIMGTDEADTFLKQISWASPLAKALLKNRVGDSAIMTTEHGSKVLQILEVTYPAPNAKASN